MVTAKLNANLLVRFVLELAVYGATAWWGFTVSSNLAVNLLAGIGAPVALAAIWAVFGSPKARLPLRDPTYLIFELAWFGAGAAALAATAGAVPAIVFGAIIVANLVLLRVWHQYPTGG